MLEKLGVGGSSWEEREVNRYSSSIVPVENQLLSGSESEEQNNLVEESQEEVFDEEDYEDELEYVELDNSNDQIKNTKQLYLEEDYEDELEYETSDDKNNINLVDKTKVKANLASKRPIQRAKETLDIEPLEKKKLPSENKKSEIIEIDDPW